MECIMLSQLQGHIHCDVMMTHQFCYDHPEIEARWEFMQQ